MSIETVKISEKAKGQLIVLKRRTGIENWNILCRWALMLSLNDESKPPIENIVTDSNVEMSWKVFAGEYADIYFEMIKCRALLDNTDSLSDCLKLHLHRGISYAVNRVNDLDSIFTLKTENNSDI